MDIQYSRLAGCFSSSKTCFFAFLFEMGERMRDLLKLATSDNSLFAAYKSINQGQNNSTTPEATVADYAKYFVSTGQVVHASSARFERFSLIDPNIHTVLSASTQETN